jgi:hypothetical protein
MSLIEDALQGVILRGAFYERGPMGRHYCEVELMTLIKEVEDPLGGVASIHLELCVYEGMFVQAPTLDQYLDRTNSLEVHEDTLRTMIGNWNHKSMVFPLHDKPFFLAISQGNGQYVKAPNLHYDVAQVLTALTVFVANKRSNAKGKGGRGGYEYEKLERRLSGLLSRVRKDTLSQTGAISLFG